MGSGIIVPIRGEADPCVIIDHKINFLQRICKVPVTRDQRRHIIACVGKIIEQTDAGKRKHVRVKIRQRGHIQKICPAILVGVTPVYGFYECQADIQKIHKFFLFISRDIGGIQMLTEITVQADLRTEIIVFV